MNKLLTQQDLAERWQVTIKTIENWRNEVISVEKEKYDATYKIENTTVHVVAPPPMTNEEKERILDEFHQAGYDIWKSLTEEERLKL